MRNLSSPLKIGLMVVGTLILGSISGLVTVDAITGWYATLTKPSFNPPNWVFGPAWTVLYILMGIAAGLVWSSNADPLAKRRALGVYAIQLALNFCWSIIFFGLKAPVFALMEIVLLWLAIMWCIRMFRSIDQRAAWLFVPYLAWVSFAAVLNAAIVVLN
jgi:benzodiazapine receptor